MTPLIKLSNITKSYPDGENRINHVLHPINLEINKASFIAIKGPSGSGKTTLLSILGTLLPPDTGSYLLNGTEITTPGLDHSQIRNHQIGFIFQDHRLMPQYTALENILLPTLANKPKTRTEENQHAHQLLELTHTTNLAQRYPSTLSGGEASRIAICRALIMKPLLLLADEPTGQLDAENARNIAQLLSEINQTLQTTIIMVTHSDETSAVAHHTLTLKEGQLR
jgi:ABC-type lipoprotein export system ATPase subunit